MYRRGMKRAVLTSFAVLSLTSAGLAACDSESVTSSGTTGTSGSGGSTATSSTATSTSTSSTGGGSGACTETKFGDDRPVDLHVPQSYSCDKAAPLVKIGRASCRERVFTAV